MSEPELAVSADRHQSVGSDAGADVDHTLASLRVLNPRQRAVIVLKFYEQRTEAEIAAIVHVPCRAAGSGMYTASIAGSSSIAS